MIILLKLKDHLTRTIWSNKLIISYLFKLSQLLLKSKFHRKFDRKYLVGTLSKNVKRLILWLILLSSQSTFFVEQNLVIFAISKFSTVPFSINSFHFRNASKYYVKEVQTMEFDSNICNRRFWADIVWLILSVSVVRIVTFMT